MKKREALKEMVETGVITQDLADMIPDAALAVKPPVGTRIHSPAKGTLAPSPENKESNSRHTTDLDEIPLDDDGNLREGGISWILDQIGSSVRKYPPEEVLECVQHYVMHGTFRAASELSNIPERTISDWSRTRDWWYEAVSYIKRRIDFQMEARLTRIVDEAHEQLLDRVLHGEHTGEYLESGEELRTPLTAMQLNSIGAVSFDKRMIAGGANARVKTASETVEKRLENIARTVIEVAQKLENNNRKTYTINPDGSLEIDEGIKLI